MYVFTLYVNAFRFEEIIYIHIGMFLPTLTQTVNIYNDHTNCLCLEYRMIRLSSISLQTLDFYADEDVGALLLMVV